MLLCIVICLNDKFFLSRVFSFLIVGHQWRYVINLETFQKYGFLVKNMFSFLTMSLFILLSLMSVYYLFSKFLTLESRPPLPPGPTPFPYIGSIISMLRNKPTFRWIHRMMDEMNTKILCVRLGNIHVIAVSDPDIALEFLKDKDWIFSSRPDSMSGYLTSGGYLDTVLAPMGDHWKKMRSILSMDILSGARHKWLQKKRNEEDYNILRYINNQCKTNHGGTRGLVNVRIIGQQYTTNMVRKLLLGRRYFGKGREDGGPWVEEIEHADSLWTILVYLNAFCVTDYFPWLRWITDFDGQEKIVKNAILIARKYQDALIDERIQQWKDGVRIQQDDLVDVFITLKNTSLTADEIKAQTLDMFLAGFDNVSNNIEWAIAEMINQPKILCKAVQELDFVVGKDRLVQESDLPKLNYIKSCVKETFRLHPVAPFNVPHVTTADSMVSGYFIPKGSHILVSRLGIGRNPEIWNNPLTFNPDRHMIADKEVALNDHTLRTFSFGTGRRGCPAVLLGSTMSTMLLARLVQGFTWELPPNELHVDLKENLHDLAKAKPLLAIAKPRLPHHLYPTS
ncbi:putative phenylalanine N-monooxygenase [Helianthus annuus]|nr:putative phenylalanine N-monooxygenase [Helianthus annuus]KAJ0457301.1 putative phenylalanine N-monooxygenase [Helianthus annuus]KAJ0649890.1 putative phenylalanine N-monooxygenase [Helianthus annuus]